MLHNRALNTEAIARICMQKTHGKAIRILDAGCGSGALLQLLRKSKMLYSYTGFDFSEIAVAQIGSIDEVCERVFVADVLCPPVIQGVFDIVVFNEVLYYVSPWQTLPQYRHMLAEDGRVVISIYNTWRRPFIFLMLRFILSFQDSERVEDTESGRSWIIKTGVFRSYFT